MIRHAVWLYFRFTLSFRDVEELLAQRGIEFSLRDGSVLDAEVRSVFRPQPTALPTQADGAPQQGGGIEADEEIAKEPRRSPREDRHPQAGFLPRRGPG